MMAQARVTVEVVENGWIQLYVEGSTTRFAVRLDAGGKSKRVEDNFKLFGMRTRQMELVFFFGEGVTVGEPG